MLDGLFGWGFSAKCKSLIKTTRARILVVRRRVVAKQRFLKGDLAKLLSDGLDMNAYGRIEEFVAGMNLLFCYDYVEQACESVLKQLSKMQKQENCPEDCKEPISLLMFAAARFSDLPELRDLRDLFRERYGNLEALVNQKFVERLFPGPPTSDNKIHVLQNIASEFSINWDAKRFEEKVKTPSTAVQVQPQKANLAQRSPVSVSEKRGPNNDNYRDNNNLKRRDEPETTVKHSENFMLKKDAATHNLQVGTAVPERRILSEKKHQNHGKKLVAEKNDGSSSTAKVADSFEPAKESAKTAFSKKPDFAAAAPPSYGIPPPPYVKPPCSVPRPPPYTKPKEDKPRIKEDAVSDDQFLNPPGSFPSKDNGSNAIEAEDHYNQNRRLPEMSRSSTGRRKHHHHHKDTFLDEERRRRRDEEERMIDKLLMHYSKRPTTTTTDLVGDQPASVRVPIRSVSLPREQASSSSSSSSSSSKAEKVLNRAKSFQPDNQAKHVHPKLPDYDDIAAKFAALRGR